MAKNRQSSNSNLFRIIVTPAILLCMIFRKPVFQWIAVTALLIWLLLMLILALKRSGNRRKQRRYVRNLARRKSSIDADTPPETETSERELFLIRQINIRITEQLKETYPMVSWLWLRRPTGEELCAGGTWRIQTSNTEPFIYGEVSVSAMGSISITMLQAIPLGEQVECSETDDVAPEQILNRTSVKEWYFNEGEKLLGELIDNLNSQGHKHIMVHENGDVCIECSGDQKTVETISNFPPRNAWDEFGQLLSDDEITATAKPEGLLLSW